MTEIGTLAELDVKPGDVVGINGNAFAKATILAGKRLLVEYEDGENHELSPGWYYNKCDKWFIISRATPAPKLWRDMTPEEKGALLLAAHEGKVIQYQTNYGGWLTKNLRWWNDFAYRIKPEPKVETIERFWYDHRFTFNLIDGKANCNSVKMEPIK